MENNIDSVTSDRIFLRDKSSCLGVAKKNTISRLSKVLRVGVFSMSEIFGFGSARDGVLHCTDDWSDSK